MDNKYQRGKIYKLVSSQTNKIYIGSTITTLKKRKQGHKDNPSKTSKLICCYNDFEIILIKEYPCNSKKELHKEEGCIIKQNLDICVNERIPGRTNKEHWQDVGIEYHKNYRIENKERILIRDRQYYYKNIEKIKLYKRENRERYNIQQNNRKWFCECCNHTYPRNKKNRHLKTKKHQSNSAL